MNKICMVTDETDKGLYILLRGVNEWVKRHKNKIDVNLLEESNLKNLEDGDTLYLVGHANIDSIHNKKAPEVWEKLKAAGLPKKKFTVIFMGCNTGNYASKKRPNVSSSPVKPPEVLAKELKQLFRQNDYKGVTFRLPVRASICLSADEGEAAMHDTNTIPAEVSQALWGEDEDSVTCYGASLNLLVDWKTGKAKPEFPAVNQKAVDLVFKSKTDIKAAAKKIAEDPAVVQYFKEFNTLATKHKLIYLPIETGWVTLTT